MDHSSHGGDSSGGMASNATMDMGMGGMGGCKIDMLWNWNTVDSCFISKTWQIRSEGMFAGSCIGVILLVMSLEFLRRSVKEYDRFLLRKHTRNCQEQAAAGSETGSQTNKNGAAATVTEAAGCISKGYRPTIFEQAIRAGLHMVQFAVAYFVMLLAMYYNGYIIICIFIGAYLGAFVFQWETLGIGAQTSATKEATVCCG